MTLKTMLKTLKTMLTLTMGREHDHDDHEDDDEHSRENEIHQGKLEDETHASKGDTA